jgi:hypothetical protein
VEVKDKERNYRGLTNGQEIDFKISTRYIATFSFFGFLLVLSCGFFLRRLGWKLSGSDMSAICFFLLPVILVSYFLAILWIYPYGIWIFFCCLLFVFDFVCISLAPYMWSGSLSLGSHGHRFLGALVRYKIKVFHIVRKHRRVQR